MKKQSIQFILGAALIFAQLPSFAQQHTGLLDSLMFSTEKQHSSLSIKGHSHNDYEQKIPFFTAYYAGMESIEADVFLRDGILYVAHDARDIQQDRTLSSLYIEPIVKIMKQQKGQLFTDMSKRMQLMIDIKEDHRTVLAALNKLLAQYPEQFDPQLNPAAVRIVISGDRPEPAEFQQYPAWIFFDGLPDQEYTDEQWKRIAMISADLKAYTSWNGKGTPNPSDKARIKALTQKAQARHIPFRFWGNHDSPNTYQELHKMGVYWINTDQPQALAQFIAGLPYEQYQQKEALPIYKPTYLNDNTEKEVRKIIFMIGDGMGLAQVKAAMAANFGSLHISQFRNIALSRTEALNSDNTDSAAGGSALATGNKTNNRSIAMDTTGKPLRSLTALLQEKKWGTAILSTGDLTDATPAVYYAHAVERDSSKAIALQALDAPFQILAGGSPSWFTGQQADSYRQEMAQRDIAFVHTPDLKADAKKQIVFLDPSFTRPVKEGRGPVLSSLLTQSLDYLDSHFDRFFIMAEGAQIDYGGHANDLPYVVSETLDFDQAVGEALRYADQDGHTLVIVTADHETGGLSLLDSDEKSGYIRGNFSTNDHSSIPVPVYIYGPYSHTFTGYYPNTEIFKRLLEVLAK